MTFMDFYEKYRIITYTIESVFEEEEKEFMEIIK